MDQATMRIVDMPERERPRERLLDAGAETLSTGELLAILVGSGSGGRSALHVGNDVLMEVGSLPAMARLAPAELARCRGIGAARAARILAALELGRRSLLPDKPRPKVQGPGEIAALLAPFVQARDREHFGSLLLDSRNAVIGRSTVAIGSLNASLVHPRELFRPAIVQRAARIVLWHNHPSGDPSPSPEDLTLTRRLESAGRTLGIPVMDHVILGEGTFHSMREGRWEGLTFV